MIPCEQKFSVAGKSTPIVVSSIREFVYLLTHICRVNVVADVITYIYIVQDGVQDGFSISRRACAGSFRFIVPQIAPRTFVLWKAKFRTFR